MFDAWYGAHQAAAAGWLQALHRHPETGFEETATAAFVANRLQEMGLEVATGIGGTGVVGTLHGAAPGRTIAIRAELDALPMRENADLPYRSRIEDRFHGCGHDGHMVTALTAAAYLAQHRDFAGTLRVIFQPAEELLRGARAMLADGLMDRFPFDEIYALHNLPGLAPGQVAVPARAALSSADDIDVTIRANGAHGSMPQTGEDAIAAAASFLTTVQQAATRVVDAREAGVISFGVLRGGTARNVLPEAVRIEGTMRTTAAPVRDRLAELLLCVARATERVFGVRVEIDVEPVTPATLNHPEAVAAVLAAATRVVGPERVMPDARGIMASEDFAEFLQRVPGAYFFVGQGGPAPHHPDYVFDPAIIPIGAAILADLVRSRAALAA